MYNQFLHKSCDGNIDRRQVYTVIFLSLSIFIRCCLLEHTTVPVILDYHVHTSLYKASFPFSLFLLRSPPKDFDWKTRAVAFHAGSVGVISLDS